MSDEQNQVDPNAPVNGKEVATPEPTTSGEAVATPGETTPQEVTP